MGTEGAKTCKLFGQQGEFSAKRMFSRLATPLFGGRYLVGDQSMSSDKESPRRALTPSESFILEQIQDMYGEQNTESNVFFSDMDEAVIFVEDRNGLQGMMTVLTNLGVMYDDGTIDSLEELRSQWLCPH